MIMANNNFCWFLLDFVLEIDSITTETIAHECLFRRHLYNSSNSLRSDWKAKKEKLIPEWYFRCRTGCFMPEVVPWTG